MGGARSSPSPAVGGVFRHLRLVGEGRQTPSADTSGTSSRNETRKAAVRSPKQALFEYFPPIWEGRGHAAKNVQPYLLRIVHYNSEDLFAIPACS